MTVPRPLPYLSKDHFRANLIMASLASAPELPNGRFPVAVDRGENATLWDTEGRAYIDFTAGIGVASLGHADQGWQRAVAAQAAKLAHVSNLFYYVGAAAAA